MLFLSQIIGKPVLDQHGEPFGKVRDLIVALDRPQPQVEIEALDLFDSLIHLPELRLDMMLEPGDLQFANNYAVLHSRNAFVDDDEPALRRKMLRLWVKMPNARTLAPEFPGRNGFPAPAALA